LREHLPTRLVRGTAALLAGTGLLLFAGCGCGETRLDGIEPSTAYPRQLLSLYGDVADEVIWDAGLATERTVRAGPLGTVYFQVPDDAPPGDHPVAVRTSAGTSSTESVKVLEASGSFPAPRVQDVAVYRSTPASGGVDLLLTVSAANLDTDARVTVDGTEVTSSPWGGLPVDHLADHEPATFGYPVYHYLQHLVVIDGAALGATLAIELANHDGQTASASWTVPADLSQLDSDGDGLLDAWDGGTYTAPSGAVIDLAAMGTDPLRKDVLVEVDWTHAGEPDHTIWDDVEAVFADAPVLNPDGSAGINLVVDRGQGGALDGGGQTVTPEHTTMDMGPCAGCEGYVDFYTYKASFFDPDRLPLFHYAVWGRAMPSGSSGRGEIWGNDFIVTFATFGNWHLDTSQVGTFVHELGHNLGLRHGGIDDSSSDRNETYAPNLPSTMNYRFQMLGRSTDCNLLPDSGHGYSEGTLAVIDENDVDERAGICDGRGVDFDRNLRRTHGEPVNTNKRFGCTCGDAGCDCDTTDVHADQDQWGNLRLDFDAPGSRWEGD